MVYNSKNSTGSTSTNDLIQFSNSLSSQIQEIRKEIDANSKESRTEIESKLKDINKQINDFHKTSTSNITQQFKESNKVFALDSLIPRVKITTKITFKTFL